MLVGAWLALQPAEIWSGQACPRSVTPEELSLKTEFQLALPDTQAQLWIDAYRGRTLDLEQAEELLLAAPREATGQACEVYQFHAVGFENGDPLFELVDGAVTHPPLIGTYSGTLMVSAPQLTAADQQAILSDAVSRIEAGVPSASGLALLVSVDDQPARRSADLSRRLAGEVRVPREAGSMSGAIRPVRTIAPISVHLEVTNLAGRAYPVGDWVRARPPQTAPITRRYVWEPVEPSLPYEALGRSFEDPLDCFFRLWYPEHPDDLMQPRRPQWGAHRAGKFSVRAVLSNLRAEVRSGEDEEWEQLTLELDLSELKAQQAAVNYTVWMERQPGDYVGEDLFLLGPLVSALNRFVPSPEPSGYTAYGDDMYLNITRYAEALTVCLNNFLIEGRFVTGCPTGTPQSARNPMRQALLSRQYDPRTCRTLAP